MALGSLHKKRYYMSSDVRRVVLNKLIMHRAGDNGSYLKKNLCYFVPELPFLSGAVILTNSKRGKKMKKLCLLSLLNGLFIQIKAK